jgi:hypothetical protein
MFTQSWIKPRRWGWWMACALLVSGVSMVSVPSRGDVVFSHDAGTTALPPPPPNAVFSAPDVADIFASGPLICSEPGPNLGNLVLFGNPLAFGLMPGDNLDAMHVTRADYGPETAFLPTYLFSVDMAAGGLPGTAVAAESPINRADVFLTMGGGTNALCVNQNQIGLAATPTADMDALTVQPIGTIPLFGTPVYFSLTPGSPTLGAIGASAADVLVKITGTPGPPAVAITAAAIGLLPTDNLDALILVGGDDLDLNGVFDPFDTLPLVFFSVSNPSMGMPGTAVAGQALGGDIFMSLGGGTNGVALDDASIGLAPADNLDALDLITSSTPGAPPFDTPVLPPPVPFGCDVGVVQISVCVTGQHQQMGYCCMTISVICPPPVGKVDIPLGTLCVPCDDPAAAMAAILAALLGATMPDGTPVFSGPATPKPTPNPLQRKSNLTVNPDLEPCKLNTVKLSFSGCLTKDLALLPMTGGDLTGLVDNKYEVVGMTTAASLFTLAMPDLPQVFIPLPPGIPAQIAALQIRDGLQGAGYQVQIVPPDDPMGGALTIALDPLGRTVEGVDAIGAPDSGLENFFELTFTPPVQVGCEADLNGDEVVNGFDLALLLGVWTGPFLYAPCPPFQPADLVEDCRVNGLDLATLLAGWGPCPLSADR